MFVLKLSDIQKALDIRKQFVMRNILKNLFYSIFTFVNGFVSAFKKSGLLLTSLNKKISEILIYIQGRFRPLFKISISY